MRILVTGAAGFIGYYTSQKLVCQGHEVYGIDNLNHYYDVELKYARLTELGFSREEIEYSGCELRSGKHKGLRFLKLDLIDHNSLDSLFERERFDVVCNLGAQAGVRYSIENPQSYISSNVTGFLNILECCRKHKTRHLVYASSSSVYGESNECPFEVDDNVDKPISLYAATKKSNELMAHTYSHLYGLKTTGLRFFTVYGPWGRPDMAYYLFTEAILKNQRIKVFNNGRMKRDFTYIDDIVDGIAKLIEKNVEARKPYKIYNLGNNKTESLNDFISIIEHLLGKKAQKEMLPMQKGDVPRTFAGISMSTADFGYRPKVSINEGLENFVNWYKKYRNGDYFHW